MKLFPHQVEALKWMKSTEVRPRMVPDQPHGGILAHAMGLGKTMTMLSMIWTQPPSLTLVVCPKSLLLQWNTEAMRVGWSEHSITKYHGANRKLNVEDVDRSHHHLVLTTFDIVRTDSQTRVLQDIHWDRLVLDEAHRICEQNSKTAKSICALSARNRWCITGTPFKNGMSDLIALSRFLMVAPYCHISWWRWYGNSVSKLREWRRLFLHIREKSILELPPVEYHTLDVELSVAERKLETRVSEAMWKVIVADDDDVCVASSHHHDQHELLRILRTRQACNHPLLVTPHECVKHLLLEGGGGGDACACAACGSGDTVVAVAASCQHVLCKRCGDEPVCAVCIAHTLHPRRDTSTGWLHSAKTAALWEYLDTVACVRTSTAKVVIFSQWTTCLDLLAWMLNAYNVGHARYDGRVNTIEERESVITHFRTTSTCNVLLTSLGAGGEGVNLTFASHVVIMEPYWNLAVEQQAIDRLHRIGQQNVTHVARLHVKRSVEEWVMSIQTRKTNELNRLLFDENSEPPKQTMSKRQRLRPQFEVDSGLTSTMSNTSVGGGLQMYLCRK